jgi:acyl-CoA synthetase (NDP forming)
LSTVSGSRRAVGRGKAADLLERARQAGRVALNEHDAKELLALYGIPTPAGLVVRSAQEAAHAQAAIGRPVALKGLGPDIQHKSDVGLVELDVRDGAAARAAFHRIVDRGAGRVEEGVLVEEMVPHDRELLVGMRRDEQFGPVVALGLGGVFTEALADVSFALPPVDGREVRELVAGLRARRLLGRIRGLPRVDAAQLERVVMTVARIADDHPAIAEIDINPLLVSDGDLVAADALVVLDAEPRGRAQGSPASTPVHLPALDAVFAPASVAVVGASEDTGKWGGSVTRNLIDGGFTGSVYPVNPRAATIFGRRAFPSLADLPETPDLVIVALGGAQAVAVVAECGRLNVPAAIVIAAGFGEAGVEGKALQTELAREATTAGLTLIGPNCMGVLCTSAHVNAVGFVKLAPQPGALSVVSQSGNIGTQLLMAAERRGIGIEKFVSSGNQATTDANDLLAFTARDPETRAVILYMEGMQDGRRFFDLSRAVTPDKPVIVMLGGVSSQGRRAAATHTGAMAGSAEVFAAVARQAGVIVATDPDEALDVASLLAYAPRAAGPRVGVVTLGGGWGVLTADALAAEGLRLADLPPDVVSAIGELLPAYWSGGDPVDLVATTTGGVPERVLELVAGCDRVDAVVTLALVGSPSSGRGVGDARADPACVGPAGAAATWLNDAEAALLRHIAEVMERTGKPVVSVPLCPVQRSVFPELGGRYAPVLLPSPATAVKALARSTWYATHRVHERARQGRG